MPTIAFDPTVAEEVEFIRTLLSRLDLERQGAAGAVAEDPAPGSLAQTPMPEAVFWANLRPRLGDESVRRLCVEGARLGHFPNWDTVAGILGRDRATALSWRRSLGRSERAARASTGLALSVFEWDAVNNEFEVTSEAMREAILSNA